jgi:hypothetical protein
MAGYSARQSTYTSGDTITAAHSNDEFNQLLSAFNASTGHTHDGTAGDGGPVTTLRDSDALNKILVDTTNNHLEFYVEVSSAAVQQLRIQDGAIVPITDNDIDLGTSSLEFKDLFIDGTANIDTLSLDGTAITATGAELNILDGVTSTAAELNILDGVTSTAAELNILDGVTSTATELNIIDGNTSATSTTVADADRVVLNDDGTMKQVAVTDLAAYFDDEITAMPNLTSVGTLTTLTVDNIIINGTNIGHTSDTDAIAIASDGNVTVSQNLTVTGDLTVSGDDITMGTNTSGNILVADGTNFNSIAVGSLSEISTVANDDVFLAVDTSGGGLKKIARSAVVSGLASSAAISNVVEDTTPQLGGDLDVNSNGLVSTSNGNIALTPNGTGVVRIDGSNGIDIESGAISIKNSGSESYVRFYCESSNAHYTQLQAAPHSAYSGSPTVVLPASADTLVGRATTDTLTNKTLTTPVIAEIDNSSNITLDAGADIILDAGGADVTLKDDGTTFGSLTNSSGELVIKSGSTPTTAMTFSGANVTFAGTVTIGSAGISEAELEILDGATVTTDELNILDGVTSTATELNILDGVTATTSEINLIDGGATVGTDAIADGDGIIHNDNGTMKVTSAATFKTYFTSGVSSAADDLTAGDAAVNLTTSSGNITIDAAANDTDIIFKGTDDSSDITMLTLDGSDAGSATFNDKVIVGDGKLVLNSTAVTSTAAELNLLDGVSGLVQADLTKLAAIDATAAELNIVDGGTSATSTTLVDADRFVVNDNGTMVQVAASDVKTYIGGGTSWQAVKTSNYTASAGQGVFANTTSGSFTVTLPASPTLGDEVSIVDYAGTFDSNALTVGRNSSKIFGADEDLTVSTERAAFTLVFTDSTQGWLFKND